MSNLQDRQSLRRTILAKIKIYGQRAGELGHRVRELVFGFRLPARSNQARPFLPARLKQHRVLQRRRVFQQAGGERSSAARHALAKARQGRQQ